MKDSKSPNTARKSKIHSNLHTQKGLRNTGAGSVWLLK